MTCRLVVCITQAWLVILSMTLLRSKWLVLVVWLVLRSVFLAIAKLHCVSCFFMKQRALYNFIIIVYGQVDGDLHKTAKFIDALKIPYIAPSFGGCESIVDQPAIMSYWCVFCLLKAQHFIRFLSHCFYTCNCPVHFVYHYNDANLNNQMIYETGIFQHRRGPSMVYWTTWLGSALEWRTLKTWRLTLFRLSRRYRASDLLLFLI